MSLWKWNNVELEVDFTDADFMSEFENAYEIMLDDVKKVKKVGKTSEIIRSECEVFFKFFDNLFGSGTSTKMFGNKVSMDLCINAIESLYAFREKEERRYKDLSNKYNPKFIKNPSNKHYYGKH